MRESVSHQQCCRDPGLPSQKASRGSNHKQAGISYNQKCYFRLLALIGKNAVFPSPSPTLLKLNKICESHTLGLREANIQAGEGSQRPSDGGLH